MENNNIDKKIDSLIYIGPALSCANRSDEDKGWSLPNNFSDYFQSYKKWLNKDKVFCELQPESPWVRHIGENKFVRREENGWWKITKDVILANGGEIIGVHQPTKGMDVLSANPYQKALSIESAKQAMIFANEISADYFAFHLAQVDYWEWDRMKQIGYAINVFKEFAEFYKEKGFKFVPCIEVLEFPKFPATPHEIRWIYEECKQYLPNLKIAFDLSHLWRSRSLILENSEKLKNKIEEFDAVKSIFTDYLEYTLNDVLSPKSGMRGDEIYVYHLGGCWKTETHGIPGLQPWQNPFEHEMKLDKPAHVYEIFHEMNFKITMDLVIKHTIINNQKLKLILEIFNRDFDTVMKSTEIIRADIINKVKKIYVKYKRFVENIENNNTIF